MDRYVDIYTVEINNYQEGKMIKLSPVGEFKGLDGRLFTLNESAVTKTKKNGIDIPINVEHGYTQTYNARAMGWIDVNSLELKDDGVYGKLMLNKEGKKLVADKSYRYLSPEFVINQKREVISIDAVALTNTPNLKLEINKKEKETKQMDEKEFNERLNALETEINSKNEQIKQLQDELKEIAFNQALDAGKVTPAQKETLMALEYNSLKNLISTMPVLSHHKEIDPQDNNTEDDKEINQKAAAMGWA